MMQDRLPREAGVLQTASSQTLRQQGKLPPTGAEALLIWTRAGNSGDWLIADACERYLRHRGIDVWRSDGSIEEAAKAGDVDYLGDLLGSFRGMLMFSGGGNIGIYPDNAEIRARVIGLAGARHRCLVFPQSALKAEPALIDPRVTVWCRDAVSESILRQAGTRTALVPDAALYMDDVLPKVPRGAGIYYVKRTPGGDAESIDHRIAIDCTAADLTLSRSIEEVIATLQPYEFVISDRLHGGLIALMLRKKVVFLPVSYHKIRSFYDTWLATNLGAGFADTPEQVATRLSTLRAPDDLSQLFRQHADPALNKFLLQG